jgi:hypothetical protein
MQRMATTQGDKKQEKTPAQQPAQAQQGKQTQQPQAQSPQVQPAPQQAQQDNVIQIRLPTQAQLREKLPLLFILSLLFAFALFLFPKCNLHLTDFFDFARIQFNLQKLSSPYFLLFTLFYSASIAVSSFYGYRASKLSTVVIAIPLILVAIVFGSMQKGMLLPYLALALALCFSSFSASGAGSTISKKLLDSAMTPEFMKALLKKHLPEASAQKSFDSQSNNFRDELVERVSRKMSEDNRFWTLWGITGSAITALMVLAILVVYVRVDAAKPYYFDSFVVKTAQIVPVVKAQALTQGASYIESMKITKKQIESLITDDLVKKLTGLSTQSPEATKQLLVQTLSAQGVPNAQAMVDGWLAKNPNAFSVSQQTLDAQASAFRTQIIDGLYNELPDLQKNFADKLRQEAKNQEAPGAEQIEQAKNDVLNTDLGKLFMQSLPLMMGVGVATVIGGVKLFFQLVATVILKLLTKFM